MRGAYAAVRVSHRARGTRAVRRRRAGGGDRRMRGPGPRRLAPPAGVGRESSLLLVGDVCSDGGIGGVLGGRGGDAGEAGGQMGARAGWGRWGRMVAQMGRGGGGGHGPCPYPPSSGPKGDMKMDEWKATGPRRPPASWPGARRFGRPGKRRREAARRLWSAAAAQVHAVAVPIGGPGSGSACCCGGTCSCCASCICCSACSCCICASAGPCNMGPS